MHNKDSKVNTNRILKHSKSELNTERDRKVKIKIKIATNRIAKHGDPQKTVSSTLS